MTTTLVPLEPADAPRGAARIPAVAANLLPAEVVAGRRARRTRTGVLAGLLLVTALLGGWYALALYDRAGAEDTLAQVTDRSSQLRAATNGRSEVVRVQRENAAVAGRLRQLLGSDVAWSTLYDTLRDTGARSGVTLEQVTGTLADEAAATPAAGRVGTVTLTGTAPDKPALAGYVDALGRLKTVASPYLTSATRADGAAGEPDRVSFTLRLDVTEAARCGRWSARACTASGGN